MSTENEEKFTVKDTKQLRKYLEKFDKRVYDFPSIYPFSISYEFDAFVRL